MARPLPLPCVEHTVFLPTDDMCPRDAFLGAYAAEHLWQKQRGEWDIEEAIRFGCKAAARTISQLGAQSALPWYDEW
jgi:hypothetical protein